MTVRIDPRTPVLLVAGLAAEPTTAVVATLADLDPGTAVVHHDLRLVGEGVLRRRLRRPGALPEEAVLELRHGCVSCTLREDVLPLLRALAADPAVHRVLVHLDPALEPEAVCWALEHVVVPGPGGPGTCADDLRVQAVVAVVDAATWLTDALADEPLAERGLAAAAEDERTVAQVVVGQVAFADAVVVAGAAPDVDTARRTDAVLDRLAPRAPRARLAALSAERAAALLAAIPADARRGDADDPHGPLLRGAPPLAVDGDVAVLEYTARRAFHPERLHAALDLLLDGVVRVQGRLWLVSQPDVALWIESAGGGLGVGHAGAWLAALDDWSPVSDERRAMAALRWHPEHGDREQSLVALLCGADPAEIRAALDGALLTDSELLAIAAGVDPTRWPDPFGDWHRDPCASGDPSESRDSLDSLDETGQA